MFFSAVPSSPFTCLCFIVRNWLLSYCASLTVSPYLKTLSMVASTKLLHLLEAFSTPWFLFSSPTNHHLVFFLLEIFNNIIQYQFDGKQLYSACDSSEQDIIEKEMFQHFKVFDMHFVFVLLFKFVVIKLFVIKLNVRHIKFPRYIFRWMAQLLEGLRLFSGQPGFDSQ